MNLKIKLLSPSAKIPSYAHPGDAGFDISASEGFRIYPGKIAIVSTGFALEIPKGFEVQIRSRSGLAANKGLSVLNSPGTIDSNYRGEIKVILHNSSHNIYEFHPGDRIAQGVLSQVPEAVFTVVEELTDNQDRGSGGLGSSGVS